MRIKQLLLLFILVLCCSNTVLAKQRCIYNSIAQTYMHYLTEKDISTRILVGQFTSKNIVQANSGEGVHAIVTRRGSVVSNQNISSKSQLIKDKDNRSVIINNALKELELYDFSGTSYTLNGASTPNQQGVVLVSCTSKFCNKNISLPQNSIVFVTADTTVDASYRLLKSDCGTNVFENNSNNLSILNKCYTGFCRGKPAQFNK